MAFIAPIVEGQGEQEAVPALLYRLKNHIDKNLSLTVNPPIRVKSGSFINDNDYFEKYTTLAAAKARYNNGAVLILLDCDDGCPATLGPALLKRAVDVCGDVRVFVTLAHREFETWFVAAAQSLSGYSGLPKNLTRPPTLDMRDAKGWLGRQMSSSYDPVTHQLLFVRKFDIDQGKACHSFARLCAKMSLMLG